MKLDLNTALLDLDGKPMENVGKLLASVLAASAEGDPVKYMGWAQTLHKGEAIEIDVADSETLKKFVERSQNITNLLKSAILLAIIKARDTKTPA